jgi:hypothetical protein
MGRSVNRTKDYIFYNFYHNNIYFSNPDHKDNKENLIGGFVNDVSEF